MRSLFCSLPLIAALCFGSSAAAQENVPLKVGAQFDVSTPAGAALGLELRGPHVPWFKVGVSATYALSLGVQTNLLVDPIRFPIVPVADIDVGWVSPFTVPGVNNSPSVSFSYCDLLGGLGLGSRDGFRFLLMGGMTYLSADGSNVNGLFSNSNGVFLGNPHFQGWIPAAKVGFNVLF